MCEVSLHRPGEVDVLPESWLLYGMLGSAHAANVGFAVSKRPPNNIRLTAKKYVPVFICALLV